MIWLVLALLTALALAPLGWALRRRSPSRGRQSAALDLHRAQLAELDRDLEQDRIGAPEHAIAKVEVQRRLLAEAAHIEHGESGTIAPLIATLAIVPVAAVLLYLPNAAPTMPSAPLAARMAQARQDQAQAIALLAALRDKIATLDPQSDEAREGYQLLGNLEDTTGDLPAAAAAWQQALTLRFDPQLAAQVAEAHTRIEGKVSPESAALFRQALAAAPPDAPWRPAVQERLARVPAGP